MIITKKAISRRTVLRGAGVTLALPWLEAMVPAFTPLRAAAAPIPRFGVVYTPNGTIMPDWTPKADGKDFEFTPILKPLEQYRDRLTVLTGLWGIKGYFNHASASTRFLACV